MRLALIPARGGSKRIPRKNIRPFRGRPVIAYAIEAAQACGLFDRIVVSTDDEEIAEVAERFGAEAPLRRPPELADDHASTLAVVRHALDWADSAGLKISHLCCIYPAAPLVQAADIRKAFDRLAAEDAEYCFPVTEFPFPIQRAIRLSHDDRVEMFDPSHFETRSQDLEPAFHDAGQFYWGRPEAFRRGEPMFSRAAVPLHLPRWRVVDIDTAEDWRRAELLHELLERSQDTEQTEDASALADGREPNRTYRCLPFADIHENDLRLRPLCAGDMLKIMEWRNSQMDILRQNTPLTAPAQMKYYYEYIEPEYNKKAPKQILFSVYYEETFVSYGGLVHIDWSARRGELSFICDPKIVNNLQKYKLIFLSFISAIKKIAFRGLDLHRIFTETYDVRPHHIAILESTGFAYEGCMKDHVQINGQFVDSLLHGCVREDSGEY